MRASQVPSRASPRKEFEPGEGPDIGFLQRILGFKVIAQDAAGDAVEPLIVLANDQRDGARILTAGAGHELGFFGLGLLKRAYRHAGTG